MRARPEVPGGLFVFQACALYFPLVLSSPTSAESRGNWRLVRSQLFLLRGVELTRAACIRYFLIRQKGVAKRKLENAKC
jgi:hypothetical protein